MRKSDLTNHVGSLSRSKIAELNHALRMALDLS
jgi:mRNA-degrading endonuclease toxin of MazEF toxin-antitoxin module